MLIFSPFQIINRIKKLKEKLEQSEQKEEKRIKVKKSNFFRTSFWFIIAAPQGGFIALHVWEIVGRKNLTVFKGCHCSQLYIIISLSFQKIETKN